MSLLGAHVGACHDYMSTTPEVEFDLEKLFLPAWAQESPTVNRYAGHSGEDRPQRKFDDRSGGRRPVRRDGPPRPGGGPGGPGGFGAPRPAGGPPRGDRPPGGPRRDGGPGGGNRGPRPAGAPGQGGPAGDRRDSRGPRRDFGPRRETPPPLPEINVTFIPEEKGVESLSRQIKMSGRSFPLFDIAQMILQKPERHQVRFETQNKPDGTPIQPLVLCAIDDSLWLSEEEAVTYVMEKHFGMFYQAENTPTEPPKGTYTFVAQCGISGVVLGPPNYHDYQNQLRRLHAERFSRMPFEGFKARVKIVKDEAVVKKWVEDQSVKTEYVCLNVPEALRLPNREEVERHFREVHLPNIIKRVEKHMLGGVAARALRSPGLQRVVRSGWEDQRRFPLQIATILSQQFASHGLQFFKVNKTVTHVSVARPHYLDMDVTPVSAQVRQIVDLINATPKCTRRTILSALAPSPAPVAPAPAPAADAPAAPAAEAQPTPEQASIIGDLHWLIHQGHVIEFANGTLETAKKPAVRPPKAPKPEAAKPEAGAAVTGEAAPAGEVTTPEAPAAVAPTEITATAAPEAATAPTEAPASPEAAPAPVAPATEPPPAAATV